MNASNRTDQNLSSTTLTRQIELTRLVACTSAHLIDSLQKLANASYGVALAMQHFITLVEGGKNVKNLTITLKMKNGRNGSNDKR